MKRGLRMGGAIYPHAPLSCESHGTNHTSWQYIQNSALAMHKKAFHTVVRPELGSNYAVAIGWFHYKVNLKLSFWLSIVNMNHLTCLQCSQLLPGRISLPSPLPFSNMHGYTYPFACKIESPMLLTKPSPQPKNVTPCKFSAQGPVKN